MNWQTKLGVPVINGVHGYLPNLRILAQYYIDQLPEESALNILQQDYELQYIILNKNMAIDGQDLKQIDNISKQKDLFNVILQNNEIQLLKVKASKT